jgi:elongation factor Ts
MADLIALIKELREITGAGMMDCKKALVESDMDVKKAQEWLKEKGVLKAAKKADRVAAEGLSLVYIRGDKALLLEVNCETDFVSRGDAFRGLVNQTADIIFKNEPASLETLLTLTTSLYTDATIKIGEKLSIRRFVLMNKTAGQFFGQYIHMNGVVSSLVVTAGGDQAFADQLAMHVTDRAPQYPSFDAIPADLIAQEKAAQIEAVKTDEKLANKPAAIIEKIIEGKVNTIFKEKSLDLQPFMFSETEELVKQFLTRNKTSVLQLARFKVGEGIEKKEVDFAVEVMSQVKNTQ